MDIRRGAHQYGLNSVAAALFLALLIVIVSVVLEKVFPNLVSSMAWLIATGSNRYDLNSCPEHQKLHSMQITKELYLYQHEL